MSDMPPATGAQRSLTVLEADVSSANSTSYQDVTGLSFAVNAGEIYRFYALIYFTASAATIGARFAASAPANPTRFAYNAVVPSGAATGVTINGNANDLGTVATASAFTTGNIAEISGMVQPSVSGTVQIRFAPETNTANGIVIRKGSTLEVW